MSKPTSVTEDLEWALCTIENMIGSGELDIDEEEMIEFKETVNDMRVRHNLPERKV